ncbi:MAG: DNA methylase [Bacillaceae bacterium]|nr:DNA methylase [Bacillaceae bacterium]
MSHKEADQITLFEAEQEDTQPVTCLGMTFADDVERRAYFTEKLREKLPELKKIEGFPIGQDEDILALSDPPYYTACPNPFISDFIKMNENNMKYLDEYYKEPFAANVSEGKYDPIYKYHPYATKVPHKAVMHYILHYTNPGDVVFDGFCGTGMTGVAGQLCNSRKEVESLGYRVQEDGSILKPVEDNQGNIEWTVFSKLGTRKVVLSDLSPAASFFSYNFNNDIDIPKLKKKTDKILNELENEYSWMYTTLHEPKDSDIEQGISLLENIDVPKEIINFENLKFGSVKFTAWSDVFICPECTEEVIFWEVAVDHSTGKVHEHFNCPNCNSVLNKKKMERAWTIKYDQLLKETIKQVKQVPVLISYSYGNQRFVKKPDKFDHKLLEVIEEKTMDVWVPTNRMFEGGETRRNDPLGITHTHHFYTNRNLRVLGKFISMGNKRDIGFILTRVATRITQMYGLTFQSGIWGAGGGPLSGTFYIPSLIKELNMMEQLKKSVSQQFKKPSGFSLDNVCISTQSSSKLSFINDSSIDYVYLDPPFGGNLIYSELNFLWESWLQLLTAKDSEAVINPILNKNLEFYRHKMIECFKEVFRILKPGRWLTVQFSNTQASVWNSLQSALQEAGFIIANVSALDKQKGSFKAITTTTAVKQDLVISAYKPANEFYGISENDKEINVWDFVKSHLKYLPVFKVQNGTMEYIIERDPRILYDTTIAFLVRNGSTLPMSSVEFQNGLLHRFVERDGMIFLPDQVVVYDKKRTLVNDFSQLTIFVEDEKSAIEWLRHQLKKKPQTYQEIQPNYMKEIQGINKYEKLPELIQLLEQNFLQYEGEGPVPSQIHSYLSTNYKDLRQLDKDNPTLKAKAKGRWYIPDPNKQVDLEKLREKALLREFATYVEEMSKSKKKLKQFRLEAIRAGFKKAWSDKDYQTIVQVGERLPESVLQEDDKLLMYYDNALTRLGM